MEHDQFLFVTVESPTWLLYVALLLTAIFFRFSRLIAVRNLDLGLVLALSTVLVVAAANRPAPVEASSDTSDSTLVDDVSTSDDAESADSETSKALASAADTEQIAAADPGSEAGSSETADPEAVADSKVDFNPVYYWSSILVLVLSVLLVIRLVFDESLTRRPRLEQNLNQAALSFLMLPAFGILMTGVFLKTLPQDNLESLEAGVALRERQEPVLPEQEAETQLTPPTEMLLAAGATKVAELSGRVDASQVQQDQHATPAETLIARVLVVLAHTTVVLGLLYIGRKHFSSLQLGISMALLYLLLPCTAYNVHQLSHVIPGACLTWAFANYRRPVLAGLLLGLACGTIFFAVFLVPLWAVFYGRKHLLRFGTSLAAVGALVLLTFALTSENTNSFVNKLVMTTNWSVFHLFDAASPLPNVPTGQVYLRVTLAAVFFVALVGLTVLPRRRNLENLLSNSAALIVMAQLWYPEDVGSYVLWYLPLLLLVMFRPRLDRFVPPEQNESTTVARRPEDARTTVGSMPRVTLYN